MASATPAAHQSWADFTDEAITDEDTQSKDTLAVVDDVVLSNEPSNGDRKLNKEVAGVATLAQGEPSIGSSHHRTGRCKPCAFFHTKGCQNDKDCQFCHLCPPGEKQRRKRLRERMCEKLGQMQRPAAFEQTNQRSFKSGHLRQASGASLAESSTQSTCSGWTQFSHSRQSSSSSVADSTGVGTPHMHQMMPHMQQMMPVFHFAQLPAMADGAECGTAEAANANAKKEVKESSQEADTWSMTTTPLALAQVVPHPCKPEHNSPPPATPPGQLAPIAAPWQNTGMVQYALVQVAVPMPQHQQHATDVPMPYGCYAHQPHPQMAAMHGDASQWCAQAVPNFAQQIY